MAKTLDDTALGARPTPDMQGGLARYRADEPGLEAGGVALMGAGRQLEGEADKLFIAYKQEQAKVDTLRAEDAYTKLRNEQLKMTFGPGGFATRRGQDAVMGPGIEAQKESFEAIARKIGDTLGNDEQKRLFQQRAGIAGIEFQESFLRHQLKERNSWATDVTNNGVEGELNQVGAIYSTPGDPVMAANATSASLTRVRGLLNAHADDMGWTEAHVDNMMVKITDQAVTRKLLAISSWDPVGAYDQFKAHATEISDPRARLTLRNTLWERAIPVQVGSEAQGLLAKAGREVAPPPGKAAEPGTIEDGPAVGPRSTRNNNPGNIEKSQVKWKGEVAGNDPRFVTFATPEDGLRAMEKNLLTYQDKHGIRTVEGIIARWAPAQENGAAATSNYTQAVAAALGVAPNAPIDLHDKETMQTVVQAMAKVEAGGSGSARRVSAVDRTLAPQTNPLPTARQVAAQLPIALAGVEKRANELYGKDPGNPDRAAFIKLTTAEIRSQNLHDVQMVTNQQREALQAVGDIILGSAEKSAVAAGGTMPVGTGNQPAGVMKLTSFTQLMADPKAAAAYQLLDFDGKRAVDTMLKTNANESERGDAALFNTLRNRINLPVDDPQRINWLQTLNNIPEVQAGRLNTAQLNALRAYIKEGETEDGRSQAAVKKSGETLARAVFQGNMILTAAGTQKGNAEFAQSIWAMNADKVVSSYMRSNPPKDIRPLFDPLSKESLVSPQALAAVAAQAGAAMTGGQALATGAAAVVAGTQQPAAAAPPSAPPVAMPATITTKEQRDAWFQTLPPTVTQFSAPDGKTYLIPGRSPGPATPSTPQAPAPAEPAVGPTKPMPAVAPKSNDDIPAFKPGITDEERAQHRGALWEAIKTAGGALVQNPFKTGVIGTTRDIVGWIMERSQNRREEYAREAFKFLITKGEFGPEDVPVVQLAVKEGNLDPADLKKAKAMLKAAKAK